VSRKVNFIEDVGYPCPRRAGRRSPRGFPYDRSLAERICSRAALGQGFTLTRRGLSLKSPSQAGLA
jgi:hypothetical protein